MKRRTALLILSFFLAVSAAARAVEYREEIPFVPTPLEVIDRMLDLAQVKKGDVLYDLGSGDGRIVIRAAQKYGIRAIGIEMDRLLLDQARRDAQSAGVTRLVEFRAEDALKAAVSVIGEAHVNLQDASASVHAGYGSLPSHSWLILIRS